MNKIRDIVVIATAWIAMLLTLRYPQLFLGALVVGSGLLAARSLLAKTTPKF